MRHFCTLFDTNYLAKGLALHESLLRHSVEPFTLHILAMDMETFWILSEMKLENVEVIPMESFEKTLNMPAVRRSRSWTEYCWTCASSLMEYLLPQFDAITYLDADIFFFSDPKVIYEEIGNKSIGIVPHRFSERERIRLGNNGTFNVGVVYAANTPSGRTCIGRWAEQCREWCFARNDNGKFGDQAYLDSWPQDYPGEVCIIKNLGVNLGPWSIGNYGIFQSGKFVDGIYRSNAGPICIGIPSSTFSDELVCYHFHEYIHNLRCTDYPLRLRDRELIYEPYIQAVGEAGRKADLADKAIRERKSEMVERGA